MADNLLNPDLTAVAWTPGATARDSRPETRGRARDKAVKSRRVLNPAVSEADDDSNLGSAEEEAAFKGTVTAESDDGVRQLLGDMENAMSKWQHALLWRSMEDFESCSARQRELCHELKTLITEAESMNSVRRTLNHPEGLRAPYVRVNKAGCLPRYCAVLGATPRY